MKKLLITLLVLDLVSCTSMQGSHPINAPLGTATVETATATAILPLATQTQTINGIVQRAYDPAEWKQIYDKDMVSKVVLDPEQKMWIWLGSGEIGFFDGNNLKLFSKQDFGLQDTPYDMAIGPDGAVWVSGRQAISRFEKGHWVAFGIPEASETAFPRLAIDPSGVAWLAMPLCYCGNSIRKFDGINWDSLWTYTIDRRGEASQLLFTPDGTLWAALEFPGSIGRYDGKTWKFYSDLWLEGPNSGIRIASDDTGNIFAIAAGREWIVKINEDGDVSRIPFDYADLELNEFLLRLFIDKQGTIWTNAELKNARNASLAYYKNNQWVAFTNLPFDTVTDFNELPDGTLLVATSQGLYQFISAK